MPTRFYPALIERAADGFGVIFPDLPGCVSAGDTVEDAARHAINALATHAAGVLEDGDPLPPPGVLDAPLPGWLAPANPDITMRLLVPLSIPRSTNRMVRVNITLPEDVLAAIDRASANRSRFLADAARAALAE